MNGLIQLSLLLLLSMPTPVAAKVNECDKVFLFWCLDTDKNIIFPRPKVSEEDPDEPPNNGGGEDPPVVDPHGPDKPRIPPGHNKDEEGRPGAPSNASNAPGHNK